MRWTMSGYDPLRLYLKQLKAGGVAALGLRYFHEMFGFKPRWAQSVK